MPHNSTSDKELRGDFRRVCGFISHGGYTTKRNGVDVIYSTGYPSNFFMCFVIEKANDTLIPEELLDDILKEANIVEAKAIDKANERAILSIQSIAPFSSSSPLLLLLTSNSLFLGKNIKLIKNPGKNNT